MSHIGRLLAAADLIEDMALDVPIHPPLEISAEAIAHRAAKEALLAQAHALRNVAAEAASPDLTEAD